MEVIGTILFVIWCIAMLLSEQVREVSLAVVGAGVFLLLLSIGVVMVVQAVF